MRFAILGKPITTQDRQYEKELHHLGENSPSAQFDWGYAHYDAVREFYEDAGGGATVFVHASKTGSMDKAVLEALAAGLPVVTSSEAFSENIPGVTKFTEGDPDDLAQKIFAAFKRGEIVYNETGRKWVREHHSLRRLIPLTIASYHR